MNLKLLSMIFCGMTVVYNQPQATVTAMLHGNSEAEARSYIYQIHPSYCSCKKLCMSGCAPSMCNNCIKAVQGICDVLVDDGSVLRQCKENVSGDLQGTLKVPSKTQKISMFFSQEYGAGFDYFHLYRVGNYQDASWPNYFDCKQKCNNESRTSTKAACDKCKKAVCDPSNACSWSGTLIPQCVLACKSDLLFYDYEYKPGCVSPQIDCTPVSVKVSLSGE